jgi:Polyketide cyclase / dehydrase and lipid transport
MDVSTTVTRRIAEPRDALFARFVPVALEDILHAYGPVPAVTGTSEQTGPWDVVGSTRTVHLADGSRAQERVTRCETPEAFGYTVDAFTNPVRLLARHARGEWTFTERGAATDVTWTYTFAARNPLAAAVLLPVVTLAWRGFMRRALAAFAALSAA